MSREADIAERQKLEESTKKAREANSKRNNERLARIEEIADGADKKKELNDDQISDADRAMREAGAKQEAKEEEVVDERLANEEKAKALQEEGAEVEEEVKEESVAGDEKEVDGVKYYLTIVNGAEKWLTLKQLRETASKVEAADEYLRTAAEAARTAAAGAPSKDEPPSLDEDQAADLLRKTALGEDEATRQLAKLIARPSVSKDVLQALDQRLSFRTELAELEAKSRDLLEDPYMGRLFRTRLNELKQEAPNTKLSDAYTGIDKELRKAFPGFKSSKLQEKLERKRTLTQVPSAAARQGSEAEEEGEEDPAQVIERMAKARGITPHVHPRRQ